jgi:hypothetical protein
MALMLTVALAGCRQETLPEAGNAIRFSVSPATVEVDTKVDAPTVESDLIKNGSSVLLYGSMAGSSEPVFATGTTLNCSKPDATSTPAWSYTNGTKYWVRGGEYSFRAVFPAASASVSSGSGESVAVSYDMASDNYDLMTGSASVTAAPPTGNSVDLQFSHACAAVRFLFKDENGATTPAFTLRSFALQNLATSGTFISGGSNVWSGLNSPLTGTVYSWTGTWTVPVAYGAIDGLSNSGWYFVIPQALDDTSAIRITYSVGSDPQVFVTSLDLGAGSISSWDIGMFYTYRIRLLAGEIDFTVEWNPWDDTIAPIDLTEN